MPRNKIKKREKDNHFCWVIAYIDSKFINMIQPQLLRLLEYDQIEVYIPTVKVLKKTFKGKDQFDEVPLLFNYGFFKLPRKYAVSRNYLDNLQTNVSAIYGWVRDPAKLLKKRDKKNMKGDDAYVPVATATSEEITKLLLASKDIGAHSADDLEMIQPGQMITLRGYPFDGVEAEFISLDPKRKKVRVKLSVLWNKEVEVSFDNVFFTLYHNKNYDDSPSAKQSLDEMKDKNTLDKFEVKYGPKTK